MRSSWIVRVGPHSNDWHRQTQTGKCRMTLEAEFVAMRPNPGVTGATRNWKRQEASPQEPLEGAWLC